MSNTDPTGKTAESVNRSILSTLVPGNFDSLASAAPDTLNRVAATLDLFSGLIGAHSGEIDPLGSDDKRFAFSLQLDSMASLLRATSDALGEQRRLAN